MKCNHSISGICCSPEHYPHWPQRWTYRHSRQVIEGHDNRYPVRWYDLVVIPQNQSQKTWHRNMDCMRLTPFYELVFLYYQLLELHHRTDSDCNNKEGGEGRGRQLDNYVNQSLHMCLRVTYILISFIALKHRVVCSSFWYVPVGLSFVARGNLFCELSSNEFWLA